MLPRLCSPGEKVPICWSSSTQLLWFWELTSLFGWAPRAGVSHDARGGAELFGEGSDLQPAWYVMCFGPFVSQGMTAEGMTARAAPQKPRSTRLLSISLPLCVHSLAPNLADPVDNIASLGPCNCQGVLNTKCCSEGPTQPDTGTCP